MSKFVKIDNMYYNLDNVTDFFFDEEHNETKIAFVGESSYRRFNGNHINTLLTAVGNDRIRESINGLEWILAYDKFGFGENWRDKDVPQSDEEQAGYSITYAIRTLKELEISQ